MIGSFDFSQYIVFKCRAHCCQRRISLGVGADFGERLRTGIETRARGPLTVRFNTNRTSDETSIILKEQVSVPIREDHSCQRCIVKNILRNICDIRRWRRRRAMKVSQEELRSVQFPYLLTLGDLCNECSRLCQIPTETPIAMATARINAKTIHGHLRLSLVT